MALFDTLVHFQELSCLFITEILEGNSDINRELIHTEIPATLVIFC